MQIAFPKRPYPLDWPRPVDFLTPLNLQVRGGCGDLEVFYMKGRVSVTDELARQIPEGTKRTDIGTFKWGRTGIRELSFQFGDKKYFRRGEREEASQEEIWDEVENELDIRGYPLTLVIQERGSVFELSEEDVPGEEAHLWEIGVGIHKYKFIQGLKNPYKHIIKPYVLRERIVTGSNDPSLKRIKGFLVTAKLTTDETVAEMLGRNGVECIGSSVTEHHPWFRDLALPFRIVDSLPLKLVAYKLKKHQINIGIEPKWEEW